MWLTVNFVDVGQGDAIWIHTADDDIDANGIFEGRNIVIDAGPYSADSSNALLTYLRGSAHHFAIIDALILTHPHDDHYSGVDTIVRHFEINDYYDPGMPGTASYQALLASFTAPGRKVSHVHRTPGNLGSLRLGPRAERNDSLLMARHEHGTRFRKHADQQRIHRAQADLRDSIVPLHG